MKTIVRSLLILFVCKSPAMMAQLKSEESRPYIEVNGTAEKEVIPDEIYTTIVLREKMENREKVTIESQEEKLIAAMKEIGVGQDDLSLADANADYVKVRWQTKDVMTKKVYYLKVSTAQMLSKVFQQLGKIGIDDAYVSKVSHSKIDSLRKVTRIHAIKIAKEKADYMLAAIGEKTGKPLIVTESMHSSPNTFANVALKSSASFSSDRYSGADSEEQPVIGFKKIKISCTVYTKFAIQ